MLTELSKLPCASACTFDVLLSHVLFAVLFAASPNVPSTLFSRLTASWLSGAAGGVAGGRGAAGGGASDTTTGGGGEGSGKGSGLGRTGSSVVVMTASSPRVSSKLSRRKVLTASTKSFGTSTSIETCLCRRGTRGGGGESRGGGKAGGAGNAGALSKS